MQTELFVLTFDSPTGVDAMVQILKDLQDENFIELLDVVVVSKDLDNKVHIRQPLEIGTRKGAAFGALTGAVVGMLGGPGGVIVGLLSGAVTGGATAAVLEAGLPQGDLKSLAVDELKAGESALMVYLDEVWIDQIEQAAKDLDASIARHTVSEHHKIAHEKAVEVRKEKIDAAYKSWQVKTDKLTTSVTALRHQAVSGLQSDQDAIQKKLNSANEKIAITYKKVLQTRHVCASNRCPYPRTRSRSPVSQW